MIVIPLGGKSNRFSKVGIEKPKWSLFIGEETVLTKATKSILESCELSEEVLFIVPSNLKDIFDVSIDMTLSQNFKVSILNRDTQGQAETVQIGLVQSKVKLSERLTIWCGDSSFDSTSFNFKTFRGNWLLTSKLMGDHWSFVDHIEGDAVEVVEKKRISQDACTGLYGFESVQTFLELDPSILLEGYQESFVAPLYNRLIKAGKLVKTYFIGSEKYYSFGTPDEVIESCQRLKLEPPPEILVRKSFPY